jgi:trigger factor
MVEDDLALEQAVETDSTGPVDSEGAELSKEERLKARLKETVLFEKEGIGPLRIMLTVTVPREVLDERLDDEFKEIKRDATIPGFRKGHAPLKLVEKRFATDVGDQIKVQMFANGYMAAVEKAELKTLGDPLFRVKLKKDSAEVDRARPAESEKLLPLDQALDSLALPKEGPLRFSCEVELRPEFELPALEKIPVRRPKISITEDDVEKELQKLRMTRATYEPVENGTAALDDLLYGDIQIRVGDQVVKKEENTELAARDFRYQGIPLPGFGEAVVGKSIGETATLEVTIPDDHDDVGLRGQRAQCDVTIREIKRINLPPLNEKLLSALDCESEDDLRVLLRKTMADSLDDILRKALRKQIGDYLVAHTSLEIPGGMSQRQTDRAIARRQLEMIHANTPQAEIDQAMDEWRVKAHEQVQTDLKLFFILEKIAEIDDVSVSEEEINNAIAGIARRSNMRFDRVRDDLSRGDRLTSLYVFMRDQKVLDRLLERADIVDEAVPAPKDAT